MLFPRDLPNRALSQTGQSESRTPIGSLPNGNGIDTLVDTADSLFPVNVHESGESARRLHAARCNLVLRDLDRLHASTETHCGVRLSDASHHAAADASDEVGGAEGLGVVLGLGCDEEKDGSLGGSFDPRPGNQSLVV